MDVIWNIFSDIFKPNFLQILHSLTYFMCLPLILFHYTLVHHWILFYIGTSKGGVNGIGMAHVLHLACFTEPHPFN